MAGAVTVSVVLGLTMQAVALVVMRWAVRGNWARHAGALLLVVAVAYHGVTEVVQAAFPGRNPMRAAVSQAEIDNWGLLVSGALLIYALAYALTIGRKNRVAPPVTSVDGLSFRLILLLTVPLLVLSMQGYAFVVGNGDPSQAADNSLLTGLVGQFAVFLTAVCGALAVIRFGPRWALPVLLIEAVAISTVGARSMVVVVCVMTLYGAALAGVRVPRRHLIAAISLVALLATTISATRAIEGRTPFNPEAGPTDRLEALATGLAAVPSGKGVDAVLDDFVYRLDGNTFAATVLSALDRGAQPVGTATLANSMALAVPSFLSPSKLQSTTADRSEKEFYAGRFGTPPTSQRDSLPTLWGVVLGYGGPFALLVLSLLLGLAVALVDRRMLRGTSAVYFLLGLGVVQFVLAYEQGPQQLFLQMRGVLLVVLAAWAINTWRKSDRRPGEVLPRRAVGEDRQVEGAVVDDRPLPGGGHGRP